MSMQAHMTDGASMARVAVIIPCFNDGPWIEETVYSVQEEERVEIVIVDDGSPDPDTHVALDRLMAAGFRVVRNEDNLGVSAARMLGLANSHAPYACPLDADDLLFPGILKRMADRLDNDPGAAVAYGDYIEFGDGGIDHFVLRTVPAALEPYRIAFTNEYPPLAMFRRDVIERLGGWRKVIEAVDTRSDWSLWMTLAEHGERGLHIGREHLTYMRRIHPGRLAWIGRYYHKQTYRGLRKRHALLFGTIREHRRNSSLSIGRRALYPMVYGRRAMRPTKLEPRVKAVLDKLGIWTLQRPTTPAERAHFERQIAATRAGGATPESAEGRAPVSDA